MSVSPEVQLHALNNVNMLPLFMLWGQVKIDIILSFSKYHIFVFFFFLSFFFYCSDRVVSIFPRETSFVWLPPTRPLLETWPTTQACALDWELNQHPAPLVCSQALNPLRHTSWGFLKYKRCRMLNCQILIFYWRQFKVIGNVQNFDHSFHIIFYQSNSSHLDIKNACYFIYFRKYKHKND